MQLTERQWAVLRAAADRIVPPDDFHGAWEAGVGDYFTRQLEGDLRGVAGVVADGLDALDAEARARFGRGFDLLTDDERDATLGHVEAGDVLAAWPVGPAEFFGLIVHTTAEGFYSDPGNGGNRGGASWAMVGFTGPSGA